jgi:hypothetical protein
MGLDLQTLVAWAAIVSAICAVIAAAVSIMAWRKTGSKDLSSKIERGDRAARQHADESSRAIRRELTTQSRRMAELEDGMARIEQQQSHNLTSRDLGPIHEKINRVAENLAANTASTNAMREQLRVMQDHLMRSKP